MTQPKLYTALHSLSKVEWTSLRKYVIMEKSESSDAFLLLVTIKRNIKNQLSNISIGEFREKLFPKMKEKNFLNLCSKLFLIFEEWIVWYQIKHDKDTSDAYLIKIYNRRGMFILADKKYNALHKRLTNDKQESMARNHQLHMMNHHYFYAENNTKNKIGEQLLKDTAKALYDDYQQYALLYLLEMKKWGKVKNYDLSESINILEKSICHIPQSGASIFLSSLLDAYVSSNNENLRIIYSDLKAGKIKKGSDLETLLCLYGLSISNQNWSKGKSNDLTSILNYNNYLLESGIFRQLGKITLIRFLNFVNVLIQTQTSSACYEFIDKWCHLVDDQDQESTKNLCYIYPKIKDNQYEDIIVLLRGKKFNSLFPQIRAIAFENMALYKTKEWELLKNRLHNHKRKIRGAKGKISKLLFNSQLAFITVMEQLAKSHFTKVKPIDLNDYPVIFNKIWLNVEIENRGLSPRYD